jgi:hypothetical protein
MYKKGAIFFYLKGIGIFSPMTWTPRKPNIATIFANNFDEFYPHIKRPQRLHLDFFYKKRKNLVTLSPFKMI